MIHERYLRDIVSDSDYTDDDTTSSLFSNELENSSKTIILDFNKGVEVGFGLVSYDKGEIKTNIGAGDGPRPTTNVNLV